ncbi:hypothetical protein BDV98DRAFT_578599 [Pterulicium gracile]|uniref:DUF6534 domain-containing protein n=1 Tax=Pterulicium gracile TaxID=1884261 RepID=A0A5C3R1N6_9AGAR|nr:hypothetical protein BDV98DRAFT_578599 [Pterula gracilis]
MDPSACPPMPDLTAVAGPYVVGHMLSFGVFGVLCVQMYIYHIAFKTDPSWLKGTVWLLFAIEVTFQAIQFHMAWWSLGEGWGKLDRIMSFPTPTIAFTTLTGLATAIVHAFYSWRIIALSKRYIVPVIIGLLSATQLVMTIYVSVYLATHLDVPAMVALQSVSKFITVWFIFAAVADVVITVAMTTLLVIARRGSSYQQTNSRVENLIKYTVETGLVTSCGAIIVLILFQVYKDGVYYYIIYYSLGKIYANTLLATLNSRMTFITSSSQLSNSETALRLFSRGALWKDMGSVSTAGQSIDNGRVHVKTATVVFKDDSMSDRGMKHRVDTPANAV